MLEYIEKNLFLKFTTKSPFTFDNLASNSRPTEIKCLNKYSMYIHTYISNKNREKKKRVCNKPRQLREVADKL